MRPADRSVALYAAGAQNWTHFDRGIPRYVVEHLRAVHAQAPEVINSVLLNPRLPVTGNLSWLLGTGLLAWNPEHPDVAASQRQSLPQIYHVMSPFEPDTPVEVMWPSWARRSGVMLVVTVYDLIPLIFSDYYLSDPRVRVDYETRLDLIRNADAVLAISQSTADDVVTHLGVPAQRVHVVHSGATEIFGGMYSSRDAAWDHVVDSIPVLRRGFMLYVGGFEFRKNLETLIRAYGRMSSDLRRRHQLVIACRMSSDQMAELTRLASECGIAANDLVLTGYVTDADLGALYHACTLFVFPSLYEGSGLPMLEAMACGAPVAASNTSTGPEILGDTEATFDPHSTESIAGCLSAVLASDETLQRLTERSRRRVVDYTWERVAHESLVAYASLATTPRRRGTHRPRLALATPWLPEPSGIAQYNFRLARELGRHVDVDVIVGRDLREYAVPQEEGVSLHAAGDFSWERSIRQPDRILYCMGNSSFHGYIYEMLREWPGAVVLHDVRLTGFYGWYSGVERPEDPVGRLAERLRAEYGYRLPPEAIESGPPSWTQQSALGLNMTREVQSLATDCFVHSRFARDVLELERDPDARWTPISVLPFGMPEPRAAERSAKRLDAPLIVSLGHVSEVKGISTLISAFAVLATQMPGARLVIAGPLDDDDAARWRGYAREHAAGAHIEILGEVSDERYATLLQDADLAVQLRLISNGEASAAIADCLSAGVPTLATDLGWTAELPDDVVMKVGLGVTGDQLAAAISGLVADRARQQALSNAALEYARGCSFATVAEAYLDVLKLV
jgi:glycosyltransferase involved in cell wall biosynthesis